MLLCPQGQLSQKGWQDTSNVTQSPERGLCACGWPPCSQPIWSWGLRDPVRENNLALQVLSSECSLFLQQILSLCNAFEVCRMGQVMQSLLISTVQREWPALKSPGNALVSVSSSAFCLLRASGKAWKVLKCCSWLLTLPGRVWGQIFLWMPRDRQGYLLHSGHCQALPWLSFWYMPPIITNTSWSSGRVKRKSDPKNSSFRKQWQWITPGKRHAGNIKRNVI